MKFESLMSLKHVTSESDLELLEVPSCEDKLPWYWRNCCLQWLPYEVHLTEDLISSG
uniref:Uncharacterized protein n=1 Tax=Anguilla anguilla TaxID=7936 RepID=A0A0E9XL36_ANGAN